jgi:hypothetical protein
MKNSKTTIDRMISNIKGHNRILGEHVDLYRMDILDLLANTHPLQRADFIRDLRKEGHEISNTLEARLLQNI